MIIKQQESDVKVIGDVQQYKTSIDEKNLDYIVTLLSSNLYSSPEKSFIRETVSNAWDSHVEAHTEDTPIIIDFKYQEYSYNISIRDFGTGLSPERFKEIYCNIGSSTKRDSNDYIGGFGLGRFAALSCSNTVHITSYYNGKKYYYLMIKEGNNINITLLNTIDTDEKNGLEITISNINNISKYTKALDNIKFFPNIYVNLSNYNNNIITKHYKYFAASSVISESKVILLGNVLYPIDIDKIQDANFISKLCYTGIVIKFNIGELEITPNRENIIYNSKTIDIINDRIAKAKEEIYDRIHTLEKKDYDDIFEYIKAIYNTKHYDPIEDKFNSKGFTFETTRELYTFKGEQLNLSAIYNLCNLETYNLKWYSNNGYYYKQNIPYKYQDRILNKANTTILKLKDINKLSAKIKSYLSEKYTEFIIISDYTKQEYWEYIKNVFPLIIKHPKEFDIFWEEYNKKIQEVDLKKDKDFINYNYNSSTIKSKNPNIILYKVHNEDSTTKIEFPSIKRLLWILKKERKKIYICERTKDTKILAMCKLKNVCLYYSNKSNVKLIQSLNKKFIISKEEVLKITPYIRDLYTIYDKRYLLRNIEFDVFKYALCNEKIKQIQYINKLTNIVNDSPYIVYYYFKTLDENSLNKDLIKQIEKIKYIDEELDKIHTDYGISYCTFETKMNELLAYIIMKKKLFKIKYSLYKNIKNNKLIKLLCGK